MDKIDNFELDKVHDSIMNSIEGVLENCYHIKLYGDVPEEMGDAVSKLNSCVWKGLKEVFIAADMMKEKY